MSYHQHKTVAEAATSVPGPIRWSRRSASSSDDLVNTLAAHIERGDDLIRRVHDAYEFESDVEDENENPPFSDDAFNANTSYKE